MPIILLIAAVYLIAIGHWVLGIILLFLAFSG
jgi:hypothetical protein